MDQVSGMRLTLSGVLSDMRPKCNMPRIKDFLPRVTCLLGVCLQFSVD
jgi:hypothetical protein